MGVAFERGVVFQGLDVGGASEGRGLTRDVDLIRRRSADFQLQAPAALRVVHAAQGGHAAHTAPVHVHLATWGLREGPGSGVVERQNQGPRFRPRPGPGAPLPGISPKPDAALLQGPQMRPSHAPPVLAGAASADSLTGALHALVHQPVQQGAAVVAEGRAAVAVQAELVLVPGVLGAQRGGSEGGLGCLNPPRAALGALPPPAWLSLIPQH